MQNDQPKSPQPLSQILQGSPLQQTLPSQSNANCQNSSTTGLQKAQPAQTGMPLSATGYETLRNIAREMIRGKLIDEKALQALLMQHFGPEQLTLKEVAKSTYGDGGYDFRIIGYDVKFYGVADNQILEAFNFFCRPAKYDFVNGEIARLRVVMARRAEKEEDMTLMLDAYAQCLEDYPPDIVRSVCFKAMKTRDWLPTINWMIDQCERLMVFRRDVYNALKNPSVKEIEHKPEPTYRDLPKNRWKANHYAKYAEAMVSAANTRTGDQVKDLERELSFLLAAKKASDDCRVLFPDSNIEYNAWRIDAITAMFAEREEILSKQRESGAENKNQQP